MKRIVRSILPEFCWNALKSMKRGVADSSTRAHIGFLRSVGLNVVRSEDYYSPLPDVQQLITNESRWNKPGSLRGIRYDLEAMKGHLSGLVERYAAEFAAFPTYEESCEVGFGPGYTAVDAQVLHHTIRDLKPARYIEVGSGLSTYYCSLAAGKNREEGSPLQMTCIDPNPYEALYSLGANVEKKEVQDVPVDFFRQLESGDVLFIDSSHIVKIDGDVPYLFLEVLPQLKPGVHIHVHDVHFPYNVPYPARLWTINRDRVWNFFWNEAMLVQAFLYNNDQFRISLSAPLIRYHDESFLRSLLVDYKSVEEEPNAFSALWLEKVS